MNRTMGYGLKYARNNLDVPQVNWDLLLDPTCVESAASVRGNSGLGCMFFLSVSVPYIENFGMDKEEWS